MKLTQVLILRAVIVIVYIVGVIGFSISETRPYFIQMIPLNLLFAIGILLYGHQLWNNIFAYVAIMVFALGMLVEIIGVQTGLIFGQYEYGSVLGPKILGVPIFIGINWFFLVYCIGSWVQHFNIHFILKIIISVVFLVLYDLLLEQMAISTGMWSWVAVQPPLQNFIGWGLTSAIMFYVWFDRKFTFKNNFSTILYFSQLIFFLLLNIIGL
jgi:putative membrane protein